MVNHKLCYINNTYENNLLKCLWARHFISYQYQLYKCFESKFMKLNILKYLADFVRKLSSLNINDHSCV